MFHNGHLAPHALHIAYPLPIARLTHQVRLHLPHALELIRELVAPELQQFSVLLRRLELVLQVALVEKGVPKPAMSARSWYLARPSVVWHLAVPADVNWERTQQPRPPRPA